MKKPFKLRSQGKPFKMIGASPLKLNLITAGINTGKAIYNSKKAKNTFKGLWGTLMAGDFATKDNSKSTLEKAGEVAYDWSGVGDVVNAIDWTVGKLGGTKKNTAGKYPWNTPSVFSKEKSIDDMTTEEISKNLRSGPKRSGTVKIGGKDVPYSSK